MNTAKTGYFAKNRMLSATVVHPSCMLADAYATACMSFGFQDAKNFLEENNMIGALIYVEGKDTVHYSSEGFSSFKESY